MPALLAQNFGALSPRLNPPRGGWTGPLIWGGAVALFLALFAQGFVRSGVGAWAVGLIYIVYDTALVAFVARQTRGLRSHFPERSEGLVRASARTLGADHVSLRSTRILASLEEALSVTIVVAAYNEAAVLAATIDSLRTQGQPSDAIIVADDGSDDGTCDVLAANYGLIAPEVGTLSSESSIVPGLRWLRLPRGGKARALNTAIGLVDTDLLITVDADTLLEVGALAAMRAAFVEEPELVAATGVLRPLCAPTPTGRIFQWFQGYEYVRNFLSRYAWDRADSLLLISGAFAGFRREALVRVGGFDPECLVEDYEVIHRLHRFGADHALGWTVRVVGGAFATTDSPATLMTFLRQRRRWFAGFLQTQLWNRDMIGNRRYGLLGTAMLPVKALDTVQPLYGLAAFGLLIWFVFAGRFMVVWPVLVAMLAKVVIDLAWLLRSLVLYRRWTGHREGLSIGGALAAAVVEPLTFQLLRHAGAAWGWWVFLTGKQVWGAPVRTR